MDYIALGHWHSPYGAATGAVTAWYSGSPEILSIGQPAAGYALVVELEAGRPTLVEQAKTGVLSVRREGFDAAELAGEGRPGAPRQGAGGRARHHGCDPQWRRAAGIRRWTSSTSWRS